MSDAVWSQEFVSALAKFSANLSKSDYAIYNIDYSFMNFGSWTLEIGKRHDRIRFEWNGKESILTCSKASVGDSSSETNFNTVSEQKIEESSMPISLFAASEIAARNLSAT